MWTLPTRRRRILTATSVVSPQVLIWVSRCAPRGGRGSVSVGRATRVRGAARDRTERAILPEMPTPTPTEGAVSRHFAPGSNLRLTTSREWRHDDFWPAQPVQLPRPAPVRRARLGRAARRPPVLPVRGR